MAAAAHGKTGFPFCELCGKAVGFPSFNCKLCDYRESLIAAAATQKREENRKARLRKQQRRQRRKANKAVEVHRRQGAGCGDDGWAERRQEADKAVEVHREQGAGCGDDGSAERSREADMAVEDHHEEGAGDVWADLEPFFFDEASAVAEHERRQQEEAHDRKLCIAREATLDRIREYDPKDGKFYYFRVEHIGDIATFDHDEESPLGPMRYTEELIYAHGSVQGDSANMLASDGEKKKVTASDSANMLASDGEKKPISSYSANLGPIKTITFSLEGDDRLFLPENSANIFSIKIVSCDVGFPIDVYGTVIARDNIDLKCVYLFRRDRGHSQLILSKDESLILTGPKRGLALQCYMYFEFDLKIKCAGKKKDKQLSKGYMVLNALNYRWSEEMEVESEILDTKLSKVMITYAVVHMAVEATFAIEVLKGRFYGEITACTTSIRDSIVLHDSKMVDTSTNSGKGVIQLLRNVVAVDMKEKLIFTIVAWTGDGKTKISTIRLTPGLTGGEEKEITCGSIKMCVKVTWSIILRRF